YTTGYHRAHGRHPAVRGRDDEGGAGGRERKRSTAGRRLGSFAGTGGPPNPARIVDGAAPSAPPPPRGCADPGGGPARGLPFPPRGGRGPAPGADAHRTRPPHFSSVSPPP